MEHGDAPEKRADDEVPKTFPETDRYLVGMDSTAACLFIGGLFAFLFGLLALALGLWAACVWLDWRVLVHVRSAAPADAVRVRQYVNRRITTNGIAQVVAIVLGLYLATSGHPWFACGIWVVAAGGIACSRMLSRVVP
jgi:hypothetical protein